MINHKRIQLTKLALALSIALSAAPTFAQNTTSAIGGRISGPDGKPASGATVSIVHTESGSVSNVTTDSEGRYVARGLRTGGPYTIIITKNGVTEKREGIYTNLAETSSVDATIGAAVQSVTITGSAARSEKFSRSNMGAGTVIGATELATQASIQRNLQDYARADPRVAQTDKERGEMSVAGQNFRYNSMTIDGVSVNDTFGLESSGSPTIRQPLSIEAIQSVQVNVANYDVTQKGYTGANINAATKSGTNTWKGATYFVFRNDKMSGDRYNQTADTYFAPPPFKETTKGGWVSGPLIQDKLFLFALVEEHKSTRTQPSFGVIGSQMTNTGITQSSIDKAQAIAKNTWGMDIGKQTAPEGFGLTLREKTIKLDWNINDDHRANVRYSSTTQAEPVFGGSSSINATNLALSSIFYKQGKTIDTVVAQLFSDWTPSFSTELKASQRDYDAVPVLQARLPTVALNFSGPVPAGIPASTRSLNFGTEPNRHVNILGTKTVDLYAGGNWHVGDHEIKFGTDYTKNTIFNAFLPSTFGNYTFACIGSSATVTYSFGAINCSTASAAAIEAAVLENFQKGRMTSYTLQQAKPGFTLDQAFARFSMKNTGLFLQDTWNVNDALTLTYGVRMDSNSVGSKPLANPNAAMPVIAGDPATNKRQTGGFGRDNTFTIDGQDLIQPRFGFNYKLPTARNMQVRGGIGLFQGAAATVWMSNPFSNHGMATQSITCSTSGILRCPATTVFSPNPDKQPVVIGAPPQVAIDFLDKSIRQPSIYKANLAFESELPYFGMVFGAEVLFTKNKDGIYYQHLNLGPATKKGTDGRNLYYNANGLSASCYTYNNATGSIQINTGCTTTAKALSNSAYGNVLLASGTNLGRGVVATVSLSRPMTKGIGWSMAYSRTDSTDVSALSSSIANSVFNGRAAFDPNENVASNSSYLVKDRVNALFSFQKKFFSNYNTRFGMFYEGRSGRPYSWTINNDLNGDGVQNDLMYIPSKFGSGEVAFYGDTPGNTTNERRFWDTVDANDSLKKAAGGVVKRNSAFAPWTNSFDMRISQEIPGIWSRNKATFSLDFMNVGNMLNKKWGHINEILFANGGNARSFVDYVGLDAAGRYVYAVRPQVENPEIRQAKGESQWAIQATVKYEF